MPERARILIVDDMEENRYTLGRRLEREGYDDLAFAENGEEALRKLRAQDFDLVLLDVMMPVMDGYETLASIKTDMTLRNVPVIMISAVDQMESVVRCIENGAEDYLTKPFNPALLRARIGASLMRKRFRDQETEYLETIETEKARVDQLLQATWPPGAIKEYKDTGSVRPRRFEEVAVLFCDIVDFTAYCDSHGAEEVVTHLEALTSAFEDLTQKYGLEKIKTIGDAFLATGGLLRHLESPAFAAVACGLEIIQAANAMPPGWHVRVGIHTGPVVAGMMGSRGCSFDLWGDTVNLAARIAKEALPDQLLVSEAVWLSIRTRCRGSSLGQTELKGKGRIELIACHSVH